VRVGQRIGQDRRLAGAAPAQVEHLRAVRGRVHDRLRELRIRAVADVVESAHGHHLRAPGHAHDAFTVVAGGGDRARHVRSVSMRVTWIGVRHGGEVIGTHEVPSPHVVDVAVAVVVHTVARDLAGVRPDVRGQVGVRFVEAGVDHGHDRLTDRPLTGRRIPGRARADGLDAPQVGVGLPPRAAAGVERIVGRELHGHPPHGRRVFHARVGGQPRDLRFPLGPDRRGHLDDIDARELGRSEPDRCPPRPLREAIARGPRQIEVAAAGGRLQTRDGRERRAQAFHAMGGEEVAHR
jgi:hypothetical protein